MKKRTRKKHLQLLNFCDQNNTQDNKDNKSLQILGGSDAQLLLALFPFGSGSHLKTSIYKTHL